MCYKLWSPVGEFLVCSLSTGDKLVMLTEQVLKDIQSICTIEAICDVSIKKWTMGVISESKEKLCPEKCYKLTVDSVFNDSMSQCQDVYNPVTLSITEERDMEILSVITNGKNTYY